MQPGNSFKALSILHGALLAGLSIFALITLLIPPDEVINDDGSFETIMQAVAAVASVVCLVAGFGIFRRALPAIRSSADAGEKKMERYRAACIVWWAMIEGPGLLALIGFYMTRNYAFLALGLFHIGLLLIFIPRKQNIIMLLNLTAEDVQKLEGKNR